MSKLQWKRTERGNYVAGKYLITWLPEGSRRRWTLYDEGREIIECDRLGTAKRYAQDRAERLER